MQIRLTVLGSRSGHQAATAPAGCDVLVTAPAGTALAAVASGLAAAAGGPDTGGTTVLYAGSRRLDPQRAVLGEPPLVDGAVLHLHVPGPDTAAVPASDGPGTPQLHVVSGPDAGGVHLLHAGSVRIGRSADADVPLDDPDVSRLHCAVTVLADGRVTVADLGSTNGTTLDGTDVGAASVPLAPGALLRIGESTLRLAPAGGERPLAVVPDLEGHLGLPDASGGGTGTRAAGDTGPGAPGAAPGADGGTGPGTGGTRPGPDAGAPGPGTGAQAPAAAALKRPFPAPGPGVSGSAPLGAAAAYPGGPSDGEAKPRRRGGLGAWARKWVRGDEDDPGRPAEPEAPAQAAPDEDDPAALLLAALGPTGRLWSRGAGHPRFLEAGLGAGSRVAFPDCGSLGVAGPRARLTGVARSVVAQLAALHSPARLEIVLLAADRARPVAERRRDWGWLGWLPHVRPAHGQDCRLLLAYDRDQAAARTAELTRRLEDGPLGTNWAAAGPAALRRAAAAYEGQRARSWSWTATRTA
ncbi:FHA domain-containing protein, partial [Streptomyces sp. C]|uniref:FHA domain-containing protein n=1 Tax=Streptomyces sp. C TaxID=253839 RepID=UPI0001B5522B